MALGEWKFPGFALGGSSWSLPEGRRWKVGWVYCLYLVGVWWMLLAFRYLVAIQYREHVSGVEWGLRLKKAATRGTD